ncbi:hypothetical protein BN1723_004666 [Verticillium longisporum]|uniref:Uncharacterized protein n=1 Tax=Verticillium longisporum TaxID=100787 RepID=A0A0G4MZK7_VERLO|nr:hypothetical protein BN1723_004666 [Verticillium longisporum]
MAPATCLVVLLLRVPGPFCTAMVPRTLTPKQPRHRANETLLEQPYIDHIYLRWYLKKRIIPVGAQPYK